MWTVCLVSLLLLLSVCLAYNRPECPDTWPTQEQWQELANSLTGSLLGPYNNPRDDYKRECVLDTNPTRLNVLAKSPLCFDKIKCANQFCQLIGKTNLPIYSIQAKSVADIQAGLIFANAHNIVVSVKSTGHSYQGQSTHPDSLNIWMRHFPQTNIIHTFTDSCSSSFAETTIQMSGGTNIEDVYNAVRNGHHLVAGSGRTVGMGGGWIFGGGLSFTSRYYGYGIDQVRAFGVVLADGRLVTADACTNSDLFWALRGGGGGNFGIVTRVEYKLHPPKRHTVLEFYYNGDNVDEFTRRWMKFVVQTAPFMDHRIGGGVGPRQTRYHFVGTADEMRGTQLLSQLDQWYDDEIAELNPGFGRPSTLLREEESFYEWLGGDAAYKNPEFDGDAATNPLSDRETFSRVIPERVFLEKPDELAALLADMMITKQIDTKANYLLGGKTNEVATDATGIHPNMRRAVLEVEAFNAEGAQRLRQFLEGYDTSVCYNHHSALEPNWEDACFGSNYPRLLEIKKKYDPNHRFNVYHGVGYRGAEFDNPDESEALTPGCPRTDEINQDINSISKYIAFRENAVKIPVVGWLVSFLFGLYEQSVLFKEPFFGVFYDVKDFLFDLLFGWF